MTQPALIRYVDINWLKSNLNSNYHIIDTQPDVHDYIKEHIPGAVYINEKHFRYYFNNLPAQYITTAMAETILGNAGLNETSPVVIYGGRGRFSNDGDGLEQTMAAYTLARFGHSEILLLDGGIDSWIESKFDLDQKFPVVKSVPYHANLRDDLHVNYKQFLELKDGSDTILIDVRPNPVYEGKSLWPKAGHIPGAINLPWKSLMNHLNAQHLKPIEQLQELLKAKNIAPSKTILLYCGTGREATSAYIVFKFVLNFSNVRIYEGSFTEWSSYPQNETVTGPDPR